jgi:C-terminal processing protease CtpA/Prc
MQAGDRIVEVTGADGKTVSLYNQPLEFAVKQLQGEAGEAVTLRILRDGPDGNPAEHMVRVVRTQIVLPPVTARTDW